MLVKKKISFKLKDGKDLKIHWLAGFSDTYQMFSAK